MSVLLTKYIQLFQSYAGYRLIVKFNFFLYFFIASLPYERPTIVVPLSNVMARAGQKLRLECTITGQPEAQITWLHNSKPLKETRDSKVRNNIILLANKDHLYLQNCTD